MSAAVRDLRREEGVALIIAMMAMLLMTALGVALILTTSSEAMIASNYRDAYEGFYAADAGLERAIDDLRAVPDWSTVLSGAARSAFIDGAPSGPRALPGGTTLDLSQALNMANCQKVAACSNGDMDAITTERPWGSNNPRWQLFAYGSLADMLPTATINSQYYVAVFVGDDPSENDGDPLHDGASQSNPGTGVLALRAEAFGPRGSHKVIELTVPRTDTTELEHGHNNGVSPAGLRVLSWREIR